MLIEGSAFSLHVTYVKQTPKLISFKQKKNSQAFSSHLTHVILSPTLIVTPAQVDTEKNGKKRRQQVRLPCRENGRCRQGRVSGLVCKSGSKRQCVGVSCLPATYVSSTVKHESHEWTELPAPSYLSFLSSSVL
jgi:hypothetical protein